MAPLVRRLRQAPEPIRSSSAVEGAGYLDVFAVTTAGAPRRSPEQWTRTLVERGAGARGQFVWRVLMGLRLDPRPSPDRIGGWRIAERDDSWIRIEASSWCATAHIVVHTGDSEVVAATVLHYDRAIAKPLWLPLAAGHRRAMPRLLRYAAKLRSTAETEVRSRAG